MDMELETRLLTGSSYHPYTCRLHQLRGVLVTRGQIVIQP